MANKTDEVNDSSCTENPEMRDDEIDENLKESFPASDPPSWTLGTDHGRKSCNEENRSKESDTDQK